METNVKINPTMLARELGIREDKIGEGDGALINWETFWELVEKAYWRNKTRRERDSPRNDRDQQVYP